jgi:hypothetical protein
MLVSSAIKTPFKPLVCAYSGNDIKTDKRAADKSEGFKAD